MNGFININKPPGMTSFDVIRELRRQLKIKKMGHLGTLDPMATGVLPVAIGTATRLISFMDDGDKCYRSRGRLGAVSDTQDQTGHLFEIDKTARFTREELLVQLQKMTGQQLQRPPMYSAVHYEGKRLYELARSGITVEVEAKTINILRLELIATDNDEDGQWIELEVECSRGTYIRTLWHDLGQALGCGAYMEQLQRTRAGGFILSEAIPLGQCSPDNILPLDYPFQGWGEIMVDGLAYTRVSNGNAIKLPTGLVPGPILIKDIKGELMALGEVTPVGEQGQLLKPWRVIPQASKG